MKLLLAEDTADLNRAVSAALEFQHYDVDRAFDGEEALDFLRRESYDAVILDIMMPKKDGLEVLREIRARRDTTPVLLLTAKAEVDDRVAGLDAGADDYLPKPFAMKELLARIRSLIRRRDSFEGGALSYADVTLDPEGLVLLARNSVRLSIKEYELLRALMSNPDRELGTGWLLGHVWRGEPGAGEDTVWLYVSYLKGKLRSVGSAVTVRGEKGGGFALEAGT
ncbi:MAG: response regulator transcription factor [Oscillospiraceae bacterium]|nr:response regulator transcription factor [Oscillospiraceae bacterium]